jgi:hypothetical protein
LVVVVNASGRRALSVFFPRLANSIALTELAMDWAVDPCGRRSTSPCGFTIASSLAKAPWYSVACRFTSARTRARAVASYISWTSGGTGT